jgi:hypothetical protein
MTIAPEHVQLLAGNVQLLAGWFSNSGKSFWAEIRDGSIPWIAGITVLVAVILLANKKREEAKKFVIGGAALIVVISMDPIRICVVIGLWLRGLLAHF